jgi:hypothetical protein
MEALEFQSTLQVPEHLFMVPVVVAVHGMERVVPQEAVLQILVPVTVHLEVVLPVLMALQTVVAVAVAANLTVL